MGGGDKLFTMYFATSTDVVYVKGKRNIYVIISLENRKQKTSSDLFWNLDCWSGYGEYCGHHFIDSEPRIERKIPGELFDLLV